VRFRHQVRGDTQRAYRANLAWAQPASAL